MSANFLDAKVLLCASDEYCAYLVHEVLAATKALATPAMNGMILSSENISTFESKISRMVMLVVVIILPTRMEAKIFMLDSAKRECSTLYSTDFRNHDCHQPMSKQWMHTTLNSSQTGEMTATAHDTHKAVAADRAGTASFRSLRTASGAETSGTPPVHTRHKRALGR